MICRSGSQIRSITGASAYSGCLAIDRAEAVEHLAHGLVELGLARVAPDDEVVDRVQSGVLVGHARTLGSRSAPHRAASAS